MPRQFGPWAHFNATIRFRRIALVDRGFPLWKAPRRIRLLLKVPSNLFETTLALSYDGLTEIATRTNASSV